MLIVQNSNATEVKISSPGSPLLLSRENYCYKFNVTSIKYTMNILICMNLQNYLQKKIIDTGCPWGEELETTEGQE